MNVKDVLFKFCRKNISNDRRTSFWKDLWVENKPFCDEFSRLYYIIYFES
jgi:hypothetical protein